MINMKLVAKIYSFVLPGSTTPVSFNFGATSATPKPQMNVNQTSDQPAMFNMGAAQTTTNTGGRVIRKAVRRRR